jgi:hypothetical protein
MILMKCPKCGREADAPDSIVDEGHKCYQCNIPLVLANEEIAVEREQTKENKMFGTAIGALMGLVFVLLFGLTGGPLGWGIVGAIACGFVAVLVGIFRGFLEGLVYAKVFSDITWVSYSMKLLLVMFALFGFIGGFFGGMNEKDHSPTVFLIGCIGGMCIGGWIGRTLLRNTRIIR